MFHMGQIDVPQGESVQPGDTRDLVVTFVNVRGLPELLQIGRTWRIQEGATLVANAQVLEVLREA